MSYVYQEERKLMLPIEVVMPSVPIGADALSFVAKKAAEEIRDQIQRLKTQGVPMLLLISNSQTNAILKYLTFEALNFKLFDANTTIASLNTTYSRSKEANDWLKLTETDFFKTVKAQDVKYISSVPQENKDPQGKPLQETLENFAQRFEDVLSLWRKNNPTGIVIAIFDLGEKDKHLGGIIPGQTEETFNAKFLTNQELITHHKISEITDSKLITPTFKFLTEWLNYSFVIAVDREKEIKEILWADVDYRTKYYLAPSLVLWKMKNVKIFTDTYGF